MPSDSPRVSVVMPTYNQEKLIAGAIESVLAQDVDFTYEILIGDDCSSDGTRSVIQEFHRKYPDRIRPILNESNKGARTNMVDLIAGTRGEYVAFLDGDDHWTSRHKLRRQVAFLDGNPDCALCFHATARTVDDRTYTVKYPPGRKAFYTIQDLLRRNFVPACSRLARKRSFRGYPAWHLERTDTIGDWTFNITIAREGRIGYLDEAMAVRRVHGQGVWTSLGQIQRLRSAATTLELVDAELGFAYEEVVNQRLALLNLKIGMAYLQAGDRETGRRYVIDGMRKAPLYAGLYPELLRSTLKIYCPAFARRMVALRKKLRPAQSGFGPSAT